MEKGKRMYANYARIRDEQGKTDYQVAKDTGFTTAFFSNWKNKGWQPRGDKIMVIAEKLNRPMGDFYEGVANENHGS